MSTPTPEPNPSNALSEERYGAACPCLHTTPCHPRCTCVNGFSSSGCLRCCSYGSKEQQVAKAKWLVERIDTPPAVEKAATEGGTPRVDEQLRGTDKRWYDKWYLSIDFARTLERELAEVKAELAKEQRENLDHAETPSFTPNGAIVRENEALREEVDRLQTICRVHRETGVALAADVDTLRGVVGRLLSSLT
jgi:hypothetical protein